MTDCAPHNRQPILAVLRDRVPAELAGASDYELFRVLFTRRSRAQVAALATPDVDAAPLDAVGFFGTRDDDQPTG